MLNHDPIYSAYTGRQKTLEILCAHYYWPKMRRDVITYVNQCDECQRSKQHKEFRAPLGEVREARYPFHITSMDVLGPFPVTPRKSRYLLTFIDNFSKYAEALPISDVSAETCARAYATQIVARHGAGEVLITDRGRNFTSHFFREVCKILGVKQINTTAYHPQSNGVVERYHKTLVGGLSHYVNSSGTDWDTLVPFYLMAYRSTVHGTSGYSPFFLLHGREMILPTTQSLRAKLSPEVEATEHAHKLRTLKSRLRTAYKIVRENARKSREKNRRYYDAKAQARSFNAGDVIYLYSPAVKPGRSAKFYKFWTGPYQITARKSALNYEIESTTGKRSVVHVNRMKIMIHTYIYIFKYIYWHAPLH
jgi:transposase InsO family protein